MNTYVIYTTHQTHMIDATCEQDAIDCAQFDFVAGEVVESVTAIQEVQ